MWKCLYFFISLVLFLGCSAQRNLGIQYEAGLYRLGKAMPKNGFDFALVDTRKEDVVGTLLSNRGWKLGTLRIGQFVTDTYREAVVLDLERAGFRIEKGCRQKVVIEIEDIQTTFLYEAFRPVSHASATIQVSVLYDDIPFFTKKYRGASKNTYFITGKKIAARNAIDSLQKALQNVFIDPEFLQTITE